MKEQFIPKNFNPKHLGLIQHAEGIMLDYARQGYDLSLRQLYYQFVSKNLLANTEQNYKLLGGVISDARLAGMLDWNILVDRGRNTLSNPHWEDPAKFLESVAPQYKIDLWEDQEWHVEVMVEKQALEGVLVPVCRRLDVPFTSNKGYSSSSALYECGQRLEGMLDTEWIDDFENEQGKRVAVIYLGDHDPSGIDMTRDVDDRLMLFSRAGYYDEDDKKVYLESDYEGRFEINRIALNMPQIRQYNPPPNPAKMTDSRAEGYVAAYGRSSWELDALEPATLARLVEDAIMSYVDQERFDARIAKMKAERGVLVDFAKEYRKRVTDAEAAANEEETDSDDE